MTMTFSVTSPLLSGPLLFGARGSGKSPRKSSGPEFRPVKLPPVEDYSTRAGHDGNAYLQLRQVNESGWFFLHRPNASGAVHALTLFRNAEGVPCVLLVLEKRLPLGGKEAPIAIQTVAGLIGDKSENPRLNKRTVLNAARQEIRQEGGLKATHLQMLSPGMFPASAGASSEMKAFVLAFAEGTPNLNYLEEEERGLLGGHEALPLADFLDGRKFQAWMEKQQKNKRIVCLDVPAARGMLLGAMSRGELKALCSEKLGKPAGKKANLRNKAKMLRPKTGN